MSSEIEESWNGMWQNINDGYNLSEVQCREMRKAFYGGFASCFDKVVTYSSNLSEREASRRFDLLSIELRDFSREMKKEAEQLSKTRGGV